MRKVIVNSTPIIAFCKARQLSILESMYGEIVIPEAVFREVTEKNDEVKNQLETADWIRVEKIQDVVNKRMYRAKLHEGEVEVMILAQEYNGEHLVIIDDDAARKTAVFLGLNLTGSIGVLLKAKELGKISEVMPVVAEMEKKGIYFSRRLKDRVRQIARE